MEQQIIALVAEALGIPAASLNASSSSGNVLAWDSLGHIAVLELLDREFDRVTAGSPQLAQAESVQEIVDILSKIQ